MQGVDVPQHRFPRESEVKNHIRMTADVLRDFTKLKLKKLNSFSYICTRTLHSFRSFAHCRAASTVIPLLPKATSTPSIQPNLGLPHTRPPLTSAATSFWPYDTHPFFPHAQTISILSDLRSPMHLFIHTRQPNISNTSLSTSRTPCLCIAQRRWYNYSFL